MGFHVWTRRKALSLLLGVIAMTALTTAGLMVLLWAGPQKEEQAVAVFAEDQLTFSVEAVSTSSPTQEQTGEAPGTPESTPPPTDRTFRLEVIRHTPVPEEESKRILIYHSHTWEAFQQVDNDRYEETEKWRTRDDRYNVVAVGEALANQLRALGCSVVHDTTAFEPPDFEQAYVRSLAMLEERLALGEEYDLYIDLHRDAIASNSTLKRTVNIGGVETARFMVLIGKGTGAGFDVKPDWEANLIIAQKITDCMNGMAEDLCREVKVKTGRFNQHIAPRCVLIECGNNLNTLEQVLNGVPYLAEAVVQVLEDREE